MTETQSYVSALIEHASKVTSMEEAEAVIKTLMWIDDLELTYLHKESTDHTF